ncbi:MAG: LamG domain-containing protein, partial [Planctomycetota bacterium]
LVPGETYYWRIDEVNVGHPDSPWKGSVWTFRINEGEAHSAEPADQKRMVELDQILSWGAGCWAVSHDVYFGTSFDDVNDRTSTAFQGNQPVGDTDFDPAEWDPCGLSYATSYYWRIDEVNESHGDSPWEGAVWTFRSRAEVEDPNLRLRYKFDETTGEIAVDSSGREYDGIVYIQSEEPYWDADGYYDGCIKMNEDGAVVVPMDVLSEIGAGLTVTAWLNIDTSAGDNVVCAAGWADGDTYMRAAVPDEEHDVYWRAGNDSNDVMYWDGGNPRAWQGSWQHFAFVKDESAGRMQIYLNGLPAAESTSAMVGTLTGLQDQRFKVGAETDDNDGYDGKIDEFRVYDRALSAVEIAAIYRGGDVGIAWGPRPYDGETDVPRDVVLRWRAGDYAADPNAHDVYFGTDWGDVNDANTTDPEYKGSPDLDANSYDPPGVLALNVTYYWRIDEVNDSNGDSPWKGRVWQFTVANFLIVDDMESYNRSDNRIYYTWDDGFVNGSGSELALGMSVEGDPVHRDSQSMEYLYENADSKGWDLDYYSEIEVLTSNLPIGSDWTDAGVKTLTLFFYGDTGNDANGAEQMYAGLEDTRGAGSYAQVDYGYYGEDMNDIKKQEWQQWDMALSDFTDVNPAAVAKLYVGFGIRGNPNPGGTPGGSGVVYFDNVRLYPPRCIPWRLKPAADFTNDCAVDLADVGEVA